MRTYRGLTQEKGGNDVSKEIDVTIWDQNRARKQQATIPSDTTVGRVIEVVREKMSLPPGRYVLDDVTTGQRLSNDATMADMGIKNGAELMIIGEPKGGRSHVHQR